MNVHETAWIGLVEVRAKPESDVLDTAAGAFVNALALADTKASYVKQVAASLDEYGLVALAFTDVAPVSVWRRLHTTHRDIDGLVALLSSDSRVQFDEFQSYESIE